MSSPRANTPFSGGRKPSHPLEDPKDRKPSHPLDDDDDDFDPRANPLAPATSPAPEAVSVTVHTNRGTDKEVSMRREGSGFVGNLGDSKGGINVNVRFAKADQKRKKSAEVEPDEDGEELNLIERGDRREDEEDDLNSLYATNENLQPKGAQHAAENVWTLGDLVKTGGLGIASIITSAPAMINAGLSALKVTADKLTLKVWEDASLKTKAFAIILMTATFALNFILAFISLPLAMAQLFNKETWVNNPWRSGIALFFGLAGALSLFAVGMQSMAFSPTWAVGMAGSAFLINFATRLVASNNSLKRVQNKIFNPDIKLQDDYIRRVKRLKPKDRAELNNELFETAQKLNTSNPNRFYAQLLLKLDNSLSRRSNNDAHNLISKKLIDEPCLKEGVETVFDVTDGMLLAVTAFIVFELKGENALGYLTDSIFNWEVFGRLAAGSPSGVASGFLYFLSGLDFRAVLTAAISAINASNNPTRYISLIALLAGIALSGANMYNVSNGVPGNEHEVFKNILEKIRDIFPWVGAAGGALVNGKVALQEFFPKIAPLQFNKGDDIIAAITGVFGDTGLNVYKRGTTDNKFPPEFLSHLHEHHSVFANKQKLVASPALHRVATAPTILS